MITEVVAALIWQGDTFMICQRPAHKARGLLWEFVGGKVEPGETKEQALIRECKEELDLTLSVGNVFMDVIHEYPDLTVHLTLFNSTIAEGEPVMLEHNDIRWITPSEIPNYEFCPADEEILAKLCEVHMTNFETEARSRFGNTDAYREHEQKTKNYTKEKWAEANDGMMAIFAEFAACKDSGVSADSAEAQALVAKLQTHITENYYTCTDEILAGLGKMYVADGRFKKNIDKYGEGTVAYAADAIATYTKKK